MAMPIHIKTSLEREPTNKRLFVLHKTADYTLKARQSGALITNLGADGTVVITLPQEADKGVYFDFAVMAAQELRIDPGAAGGIYIAGAKKTDGLYITANDEGESLRLVCDGNHDWVVFSPVGTWSVEGE